MWHMHQVHVCPLYYLCNRMYRIFEETDDDNQAELACNTLKDKGIRIHDRSAGNTCHAYTL